MKIRSGFVSNSSSSSFLLISKEREIPNSKKYGETFENYSGERLPDYERISIDATTPVSYCRSDIKLVTSLEDKLTYLTHIYAYWYQNETPVEQYFIKMSKFAEKILELGKKRWYLIVIHTPPLYGSLDKYADIDGKFDNERLETWVAVDTEATYVKEVADMVDDEDTTRLEEFLFNPNSFALLGGDEYEETYRLEREAKKKVVAAGFEYERIADYPDREKGYYPDYPEYEYHWGEYDPDKEEDEEE